VSRLLKKTAAGAAFLITQPVFDLARFDLWWNEVTRRGIHEKVAIVAGIQPLGQEELAAAREGKQRPSRLPEALLQRVAAKSDPAAQRAAAVEIALETIRALSRHRGLRGFAIGGDGRSDTALEIIERSGLGSN
jgi:methylenetetrahydrofolate reductase (NADPH)